MAKGVVEAAAAEEEAHQVSRQAAAQEDHPLQPTRIRKIRRIRKTKRRGKTVVIDETTTRKTRRKRRTRRIRPQRHLCIRSLPQPAEVLRILLIPVVVAAEAVVVEDLERLQFRTQCSMDLLVQIRAEGDLRRVI